MEQWEVQADTLMLLVSLDPDPVALAAIKVQVDRLDARARAVGFAARTWRHDDLAHSTARSAATFVVEQAGMMRTACGTFSTAAASASGLGGGAADCYYVRGSAIKPCVVIDEAPALGGLAELDGYRPSDVYRVDVYKGGAFIQAYTTWFMAAAARRPWPAMPVEAEMMAYCGNGAV